MSQLLPGEKLEGGCTRPESISEANIGEWNFDRSGSPSAVGQ